MRFSEARSLVTVAPIFVPPAGVVVHPGLLAAYYQTAYAPLIDAKKVFSAYRAFLARLFLICKLGALKYLHSVDAQSLTSILVQSPTDSKLAGLIRTLTLQAVAY